MPIKIGADSADNFKIGDNQVGVIMLGNKLIWPEVTANEIFVIAQPRSTLTTRLTVYSSTYFVDWGDGIFNRYVAGQQASAIPSGTITVATFGAPSRITFDNNEFRDIEIVDASTLTSMENMCLNLEALETFITSPTTSVTNFISAWSRCSSLTSFPLIDVSGATSLFETWNSCFGLTSFPLIDTSTITDFTYTFSNLRAITSFPLIDTSSAIILRYCWSDCWELPTFPAINTSQVTDMSGTWNSCGKLTTFPAINTSQVTDMNSAWTACTSLTSFPLIDTGSVIGDRFESPNTGLNSAWRNCTGLTTFPAINTSNLAQMDDTWNGCTSLTSFPSLDLTSIEQMDFAWANCSSLASIDLITYPDFDLPDNRTRSITRLFQNCTSLVCITNIDTRYFNDTLDMFDNTPVLTNPNATEQTAILAGSNYINANPCP